ncbi:MAG: PIN domain-containing protein [Verrucomicrobia bacterium]|nr:PIN domain-containing protein [Verrucomicrobiota bacterium]
MSYSLDANILIYASDQRSSDHVNAIKFLSDCLSDSEPLYLCWPTVLAYLRITTHPSIFASPLSPQDARQNIESLRVPHVRFISEGDNFWEHYEQACEGLSVRGNLVPDAHIAALLREHGIRRIYSRDRDFLKFPFLEVVDPFV